MSSLSVWVSALTGYVGIGRSMFGYLFPSMQIDQFGCEILKVVGPTNVRFLAKNQHTP